MDALTGEPPWRTFLSRRALQVAPRLVGALIRSDLDGAAVTIRVTEVEAYEGSDDPASHAFRGRTPRTAVMFGPAGHLYCYFTYGMHWCANVVCGGDGSAGAVLLRAGRVVDGLDAARGRRPAAQHDTDLARGPARLATCLGLGRDTDGMDLLDPSSPVRILHLPGRRRSGIEAGPRVGITRAVERPWRFWLAGDPSVSTFRPGARKGARREPAD